MTKVLAHDMQAGEGPHVSIRSGRYAIALCGEFDHAKASFRVKFGRGVSLAGIELASFTVAAMKILELPASIVWVELSGSRADTSVSGVICPLDR